MSRQGGRVDRRSLIRRDSRLVSPIAPIASFRISKIKRLMMRIACSTASCAHAQGAIPENDIAGIENGLVSRILVEGEKPETYNLRERMQRFNLPGLSAEVFKDGKVIWAQGYGYADWERRIPVDTHTRFPSASVSKSVTAFTQTEKVTIRRLLNHTGGLNVGGFPGYEKTAKIPNTKGVLDGEGNSPKPALVAVPGAKYSYSGGGYVVLQKVVEDLTGKPFARYMQEELLTPLEMNESSEHPR